MSDSYVLDSTISFWNVDREQFLTLTGIFQLLQEGAIRHADQHGLGAQAKLTNGDTWFLNRISAAIHRYPRYGETIRLTTWSSGIRAFKGYREFRLHAGGELLLAASSLWLRLNHQTKALVSVPPELARAFPARTDDVFHAGIEKLRFEEPPDTAAVQEISLRYSDIDLNGHVNNAAYFDYVQTALAGMGESVHPARLELHFLKEISPNLRHVVFRGQASGGQILFSLGSGPECFTRGRVDI